MNSNRPEWITAGQGRPPDIRWAFTTDAPLVAIDSAAETGEVLAADSAGGLYLLSRTGAVIAMTRGFQSLKALAWSDTGQRGAAIIGSSKLVSFGRELRVEWSMDLPDAIQSVAIEPFGNFIAIALSCRTNFLFGPGRRRQAEFETIRPLRFMEFLAHRTALVASAEHGLICSYDLEGFELWSQKSMSNVGDLCTTGSGDIIYLAGYHFGIQMLTGKGRGNGSYMIEGTPNHVSCGFIKGRLAASTLERDLYWLTSTGNLGWATTLPDDVIGVKTDPFGHGMVVGLQSGRLLRLEWGILP